jgi:beta-1,4-mannosyltransferase
MPPRRPRGRSCIPSQQSPRRRRGPGGPPFGSHPPAAAHGGPRCCPKKCAKCIRAGIEHFSTGGTSRASGGSRGRAPCLRPNPAAVTPHARATACLRGGMHLVLALLLPIPLLLVLSPLLALAAHVARHRGRLRELRSRQKRSRPQHAGVVSVSPASHSPRAVNHVQAFARSGKYSVCFHAHGPCPSLGDDGGVTSFAPIRAPPATVARKSLLRSVATQAAHLYASLVTDEGGALQKYDVIVLNTPPCIPAFAVVLFAARAVHSCPVIVDWHNFAHSIMQTTGASRRVRAVARALEWVLGRQMDGHLCVSAAMARFLADEWAIDARVLYDRPRDDFAPVRDVETRHRLFRALHEAAAVPAGGDDETVATVAAGGGGHEMRRDRPAVIVSSTSWTPDEDFKMLLAALVALDRRLAAAPPGGLLPYGGRVVCAITGRGPLREEFERAYRAAGLRRVDVWFAWLAAGDYPLLLGSADVGVSMHTSSSGLDLPMKVVDMLGCGLPVVAYRYRCIGELVQRGRTGELFDGAEALADCLHGVLFAADGARRLGEMAQCVGDAFSPAAMRWQATWERDALPLVVAVCGRAAQRRARR